MYSALGAHFDGLDALDQDAVEQWGNSLYKEKGIGEKLAVSEIYSGHLRTLIDLTLRDCESVGELQRTEYVFVYKKMCAP